MSLGWVILSVDVPRVGYSLFHAPKVGYSLFHAPKVGYPPPVVPPKVGILLPWYLLRWVIPSCSHPMGYSLLLSSHGGTPSRSPLLTLLPAPVVNTASRFL